MKADLHCHSRYSDGSATLSQIADFAARAGLTHLALTDHDTMAGVERLTGLGRAQGLTVIPGVECSCTDPERGRPAHILCYRPERPEVLTAHLAITLENRRQAKLAMLEKLQKLYPIREADVLRCAEGCPSLYEVHLIQPLADMGYTHTVSGPFMDSLIGKGGSCYVPVIYPTVYETLDVMRQAGGVIVLAHPGQFDSLPLARELCEKGLLDGIECHHPRNSPQVTADCEALAEEYGLIHTGGTDFHGHYTKQSHPLGSFTTDEANLRRILPEEAE